MPHILIAAARFYPDIAEMLINGAKAELEQKGATFEIITVPGAFELPGAIRFAMQNKKYDGYVALGCVIRGETSHYDHVCEESARGLQTLVLMHGAAIGYGILTVENKEQAIVRADPGQGNKGLHAAEACLAMLYLKNRFTPKP